MRGTYCAREYRGIAQIREEIFALDPYHPTFGTSACGEVWMWQEEGFGLGLDVVNTTTCHYCHQRSLASALPSRSERESRVNR